MGWNQTKKNTNFGVSMKNNTLKSVQEVDYTFKTNVFQRLMEAEEKVFCKVLKDFLDREPTEVDARRCQKISKMNDEYEYILCYDNIPLGWIKKQFSYTVAVTFIPYQGV